MEATRLLQEAYEQAYGVFDYIEQERRDLLASSADLKRPLSVIAMHSHEDVSVTNGIMKRIKQFADLNIGETYRISLDDFFDLPVEYATFIIEDCAKRVELKIKQQDGILSSFNETKK